MSRPNGKNIESYISPLNMNGLVGRMLRLPPPGNKKREILLIYGHHSNIERWWPLAKELNHFGGVTAPDLPGFGGMNSMYKIGRKPTLDALADYLAAFVKLRYKHRRVTIIGVSFGFVVATRMLQRYPDLAKKVDVLVSMGGFAHRDDFRFSRSRTMLYRVGATIFARRLPAIFFRHILLQPIVLRRYYMKTPDQRQNLAPAKARVAEQAQRTEIKLWHQNEVRTYMTTAAAMLRVDNCQIRLDVPVWHVSMLDDRHLDNHMVEQHLKVVFSDYHHAQTKLDWYDTGVLVNPKNVPTMVPPKLRHFLAQA